MGQLRVAVEAGVSDAEISEVHFVAFTGRPVHEPATCRLILRVLQPLTGDGRR